MNGNKARSCNRLHHKTLNCSQAGESTLDNVQNESFFFHYEDSPFASQQNISDHSPHVEVLWEFGPKHSKRSAVKRRAPFSKWMSCFGIEITMDYLIVEDYNHTSLKDKISDWNFFRHWNQTMLFLGKPLFEKRFVFVGIAQIAFDPSTHFCQRGTVLHFFGPYFFPPDERHNNMYKREHKA